jgi:hypothetical protein
MRSNFLRHCVWDTYAVILDACCEPWNVPMATVDVLASTGAKLLAQVKTEGGWYEPPGFIGERDGVRTHDLLIKRLFLALWFESRSPSQAVGSPG